MIETFIEFSAELDLARVKHPKGMNSVHEAYAVILEELDEFWEECRKQTGQRCKTSMRKELIQIAAMCARAIEDLQL
jgi:hypothetical protein